MKIVFMGTPEFAVPSLKKLIDLNYDIALVVTQPDKPQGRKRRLVASPVKEFAIKNNIPVFQPSNIRKNHQPIYDTKADLIVTAAYGQMLPKKLITDIPAINVHGSLLPKYRGGAPIQYALFDGLKETGVTIMDMAFKMDSGDIIKQDSISIEENDNYETLSKKLSVLGSNLLIDVLENDYERRKQNESEVTFSPTLNREDEFLNFYDTADNIINHLRGLLPEPGATIIINNEKFKVYNIKKSDIISNEAGRIVLSKKALQIQTKTNNVNILEIQAPGKRRMNIKDFLNGQKIIKNNDKIERGN